MLKINIVKRYSDERGSLIAIEGGINIPFEIKRLFYIYDVTGDSERGAHAHHLAKQYIICINGSLRLQIKNATEISSYVLDDPTKGFYVPELTWIKLTEFSPGAIALVLTDTLYDESDYIRREDEFDLILKGI
jgi:dTDP-4-dehydrorhamnose 3,5-epimerase-like enzyme